MRQTAPSTTSARSGNPGRTLSASWSASAGSFRDSRTGLELTDDGALANNRWTVPSAAGEVTLWVVLRDNRGGVSWKQARLIVE